jgi:hypothetical protein
MNMKRQIALALALAVVAASTPVDAQLRGLIRKKAGEIVGGKKPEPAPTPPATTATAPAPDEADPAPAPAPTPAPTATTGNRAAASPLETSQLPVGQAANQVLRGNINARGNGDWDRLPGIPPAAVAAAYGLGDAAKATLVETVGAALKMLVMSPAFLDEHTKFIQREHQAADHGLTGVIGMEEALKKNDMKALEAIQAREVAAITVDQVRAMPPDSRKFNFTQLSEDWKKNAANPKRRDQAKFQKMVTMAQAIESLPPNDEKFIRGFAVIMSIDSGGPDTEAALFALAERATREKEQLAYDRYNLKSQLKQQLTAFVAIAPKVNFKAATVEKNNQTVFVNAADERQGALWKACFRAGEGPTNAALKLARAWLAEL